MRLQEFTIEPTDEVFSYWMGGTKLLHFNASLLGRIQKVVPEYFRKFTIPINAEIYDLCMKHRGIEEWKVERLRGKHLREPGLIALWAGDKMDQGIPDYTVVDGHHRIVRRYRGGLREMDFWACLPPIWEQVLMPSTPEDDKLIASFIPEPVSAADEKSILHRVTHKE